MIRSHVAGRLATPMLDLSALSASSGVKRPVFGGRRKGNADRARAEERRRSGQIQLKNLSVRRRTLIAEPLRLSLKLAARLSRCANVRHAVRFMPSESMFDLGFMESIGTEFQ